MATFADLPKPLVATDMSPLYATRLTHLSNLIDRFAAIHPDMPVSYVRVLSEVGLHQGLTLSDLRDLTGYEQSAITRMVQALGHGKPEIKRAGMDLVFVRPHPANARYRCVYLSRKGQTLLVEVLNAYEKFEANFKKVELGGGRSGKPAVP